MATALLERARMVEGARRQPAEEVRLTVDDLRRSVWRHVSLDSVRRMMEENPERAKAELRAACKQAFVDANWAQLDLEEKQRLVNELLDHVFGMGPLESLIRDESVTEIMVNGAKSVYCERNGKLEKCGFVFSSDDQVRMLIDRILGPLGRRIDESSPMVSARLPQGHRVHAVLPPACPRWPGSYHQGLRTQGSDARRDGRAGVVRRSDGSAFEMGRSRSKEHRRLGWNGQRQDDASQRLVLRDSPWRANRDDRGRR